MFLIVFLIHSVIMNTSNLHRPKADMNKFYEESIFMKNNLELSLDQKEQIATVCHALSSEIRLDILYFLSLKPAIITDVAARFHMPLSSAALHIKTLENAGLIEVQAIPGSKGSKKLCGVLISKVDINMFQEEDMKHPSFLYQENMPIGCYFDYDVKPSCGITSELCYLGPEDDISVFYSPERFKAQIIWMSEGYLSYRFSNRILKNNRVTKLQYSLELCAEALGYNNDWKSDISVWINNVEIGILHCSGDFGGRKGRLNPNWWNAASTQFGELKTITITNYGCFIDNVKVSNETLDSLKTRENNCIDFRIGVRSDAKYVGGFNLFGEKFGDYPQGIVMEVYDEEQ